MASRGDLGAEVMLYRRLIGARLRGQLQYKGSFLLLLAGNLALHLTELIVIFILFRNFDSLGGWDAAEVAFLYSLSTLSFGLAKIVSAGLTDFARQIVRGDFDRVLTRPAGAFVQVLAADVQLHQLGRFLSGLTALLLALRLVDLDWTVGRLLYFPVVVVSGVVLFTALFALEATLCFWTTEATEVVNAFTYGGTTLAQYPIHIFDAWLRRLFLFVVPLGFVVYAPALYLLDKSDPLGLPAATRFVAPLAAIGFAVAAGAAWGAGVRRYRSTGS